ncbi:protein tweety homolog 2-like isoform X2 [Hemibagrus wyckioides]|uniref:protein tweety homolog 2-like isoform X2 n=1 Tax=Hemibagrus wyckioides TaxID=337641 RepID=UPI00266C0963|nr:protein tweety homolog 2-like isoform X2 [Hemibagrus wyckioides]
MASARQDYVAPWWTYWLHNFPHVNFHFQSIDSAFKPGEVNYQQSLIFLACIAAVGLVLSLLLLGIYLSCLCFWHRKEAEETKRPDTCCFTWAAVITGLVICSAVGVGFYGNSETNDGIYQMTYSLYNTNNTLAGIDSQVAGSLSNMQLRLKEHLARLDEIFSPRQDYTQTVRFMQQMADNIIRQLTAMPNISHARQDIATVADKASYMEYYRWLMYLLLLILDLVICLGCCLGLAKHSRWLLALVMVLGMLTLVLSWASLGVATTTAVGASDFCVAPDKFIVNQTKAFLKEDIAHYYLYCSQTLPNPFQQSLTIFQRSLTTMQIQIQGLLQISISVFPTAEGLLNATEISLHHLTAWLDCRSLHKDYLDALVGLCYDGVEGLLYLCLFSLLAACSFCAMLCTIPRAYIHVASRDRNYDDIDEEDPFNPQSRHMAPYSTSRTNVHSFCSYSSSLGSQSSLQPPLPTTSTAPPPEYMNQSMLFAGNPRYENVPLIGRGSPPPSYSPSMRTTYLSMTDAQMQHIGNDYQV